MLAGAAVVVGLAPTASAAYSNEPVGSRWVPDGGVHAVVTDGARVYVGGSFSGNVAALDASSGELIWRGNADGDVRALALGPDGSLLMGGAFNTVGGVTHRKIASVDAATGAVNATFRGAAGGTVRDIVVVGSNAYFAGAFTNHGGMTQQGLGAVNASTGANVTGFTTAANGTVYALGTDGNRLFIGGNFTTVGGQPRNQLASVTLSNHSLDAWAPARACTGCNLVWDLTLDNARNRVYTVGRNGGTLYTLDKTSGRELFRATGGVNGDAQAVTLAPDGKVYVGGHFVTVAGQTRMLVAEFDVSGTRAVLGPFSTRFVTSYPGVWAMASTSTRLYVGGDFTQAGAQNRYPFFAIFPVAGAADTVVPTVTTRAPGTDATGVAANANVTATFSEAVQAVSGTTFTLRNAGTGAAVTAAVSYDGATRTATLNPGANLAAGTRYTATLTGGATAIRDLANNPLATTSWSFTTASGSTDTVVPTVTTRAPGTDATGVAADANVTATFSEAVQAVSGTTFTLRNAGTGAAVTAAVSYDGATRTATLNPGANLAAGTRYTATLTGGASAIRDLANNPLATTGWSFTTASGATDTTAPVWTGRIPSRDGATGVSRTANVTVTFSEVVENVDTTSFTLRPTNGTADVAATVSFSTTSGRWVLNPSSALASNTQYTATVSDAVTDLAGNHFVGMSWSFTTAV
jgi:hypothetical protein